MRIYADFNGIEECLSNSNELCLDLTGYGTLASLSFHKVKLYEGQSLELGDPDGLTAKGLIYFDQDKISENCSGWFAKFQRDAIVGGEPLDHDYNIHICFKCRNDIKPHLDVVGRQFREECPFCGTPVMFPLSPPYK